MVVVAQLVRASVCGAEGRGFETRLPPILKRLRILRGLFFDKKRDELTTSSRFSFNCTIVFGVQHFVLHHTTSLS